MRAPRCRQVSQVSHVSQVAQVSQVSQVAQVSHPMCIPIWHTPCFPLITHATLYPQMDFKTTSGSMCPEIRPTLDATTANSATRSRFNLRAVAPLALAAASLAAVCLIQAGLDAYSGVENGVVSRVVGAVSQGGSLLASRGFRLLVGVSAVLFLFYVCMSSTILGRLLCRRPSTSYSRGIGNRNGAQGARGDSPVRTVTAEDSVGWRRGFGEESQYTPCGSLAEGTSIRV